MSAQLATGAARRVTVEADGHRLAALRSGADDAPPVLLLPGYTGSKEDFAPVLASIGQAGFCATAVDLPGQFESPGLGAPEAYTTDALGAVVGAACAVLGPHVRLVGHSFGGLVARACVLAGPTPVRSVALLSSGPGQLRGRRRAAIEQLEPVLAGSGLAAVYAAIQAAASVEPGFVPPPPELAAFLQRRFLGGDPAMLQGMGDALRTEPDRVAALAATGVPVLVVHGVDDDAWPADVQRDMADRLGARYELIDGAAHSPAVENPAAVVDVLLDFWATQG